MDRPIPERRLSEAPAATHPFPTWAHAGKDMVGTSLGSSRLWFTVAEGILTEVYYPRIDIPQIRDLGFIVADGKGFWAEVKRVERYSVRLVEPGVPAVAALPPPGGFPPPTEWNRGQPKRAPRSLPGPGCPRPRRVSRCPPPSARRPTAGLHGRHRGPAAVRRQSARSWSTASTAARMRATEISP